MTEPAIETAGLDIKLKVFWIAFFLSCTALGIYLVAFSLLIVKNYGAYGISMTTFAFAAPQIILVLFGGLASDAFNKQKLYRICQLLYLILAFLLVMMCLHDVPPLWFLVCISIANGVLAAFYTPNHASLISAIAPLSRVAETQQIFYFAAGLGSVIGPILAAHILSVDYFYISNLHSGLAFFTYFLGSIPLLFCIPKAPDGQVKIISREHIYSKVRGVFSDIQKSLIYLRSTIDIRVLMRTLAIVFVFGTPFTRLLSIYAHDYPALHHSSTLFSHLFAALGIGNLSGSLIGIYFTRFPIKQAALFIYFIIGLFLAALSALVVTQYWAIAFAILLSGLFSNLCTNLLRGLIQSETEIDMRGRVAAFAQLLACVSSLSVGVAGYIMHKLNHEGMNSYSSFESVELVMLGLMALLTLIALPSIRRTHISTE